MTIKETALSPYHSANCKLHSPSTAKDVSFARDIDTVRPDSREVSPRSPNSHADNARLHLMSGNDLSVPSLLRFFRPTRRRRILARVPFLLVLYRSKLVSPVVEGNGIGRSAVLVAFNDF